MLSCLHCAVVFIYSTFFFFFKQKTAYEMRISDWSSDVCSSDLLAQRILHPHPVTDRAQIIAEMEVSGGLDARDDAHHASFFVRRRVKIGRASCRERVCQYV